MKRVYKSQQKPGAGKSESPKDAKPDKDNVVDADFEDVKEKEEDKEKAQENKGDVLWLKEIVMMS